MRRILLASAALATALPFIFGGGPTAQSQATPKLFNRISGTVSVDPADHSVLPNSRAPAGIVAPSPTSVGCTDSGRNVRANQECTNQSAPGYYGRGQSQNETAVAVNPTDPSNIIISQNDYRRGDSSCAVNFSLDGGQHWGSRTAPQNFGRGFLGGARHYWTTGGDTSVGFDSTGEAYLMCQVFDRPFPTSDTGDQAAFGPSGFEIFRSADGGASWSFPGDYVATTGGSARGDVGLLDKEYMTIDSNPDSPQADRIYVSWTNYNTDFTQAPIYLAYSDDHGVTWHQSGNIVADSPSLCPINFSGAPAGTCDNNQFSDPFVAPNGDVFVVFANFNNCSGSLRPFGLHCRGPATDNHNQMLIVKSTDGGNTFSAPVKVADYFDLPDCATYTHEAASLFRACVPTAPLSKRSVFRAANYPSGVAVDDDTVVVDFGSYINRDSKPGNPEGAGHCEPDGLSSTTFLNLYQGVGVVNGCNNDILVSTSTDGGAAFDGTTQGPQTLPTRSNERPSGQLADQWFQWSAKAPDGTVVGSYYDRKYDGDMPSGAMDFTMAIGLGGPHVRVTEHNMPPSNEFPGVSGFSTFMGDYTGIAVGSDGIAHPAWEDTRNPIYTFDLTGDARTLIFAGYGGDIYTASLGTG